MIVSFVLLIKVERNLWCYFHKIHTKARIIKLKVTIFNNQNRCAKQQEINVINQAKYLNQAPSKKEKKVNGKCRGSKIINEYNGGFPFTTEDIVEEGEETGSTNQERAHRGLKARPNWEWGLFRREMQA